MQIRNSKAFYLKTWPHSHIGNINTEQARREWLQATASELRDVLRFNQSSLKEAINSRIRDTTEVELFLNTQGPDLVQNVSCTPPDDHY